jgi:hypothetical protein
MPSDQEKFEAFREAIERAGTEVLTWIPEKVDDRIAGPVVDMGTVTTPYGISPTTTHEVFGDYVENGETKSAEHKLVRVAWMGAVLEASYFRMLPTMGDFCAFHYQSDVTPKTSGYNDYKLVAAVVLDGRTETAKVPANLGITIPTRQDLEYPDAKTGELPDVSRGQFTSGQSPLEPRREPDLPTPTAEEMAAAEAKRQARRTKPAE